MFRKLKNIVSLFLLLVFLLPSIVKLEHHHEHKFYLTAGEKQVGIVHEKCPICNFEFSVFLTSIDNIDSQKEKPFDNYTNNYNSRYYSNFSQFSFSLRAPPLNIHN